MRAALASVLAGFQGLEHDDSREKPVDRLGALGLIQRKRDQEGEKGKAVDRDAALASLGVDLIRFKFSNCADARPDAIDKLAGVMSWRSWGLELTRRERSVVSAWAVQEWAIDLCPTCAAAGEVPDCSPEIEGARPMKRCSDCKGTGKRRYSDEERAEAMGATYEDAMSKAHEIIGRAEASALEGARRMLERWS